MVKFLRDNFRHYYRETKAYDVNYNNKNLFSDFDEVLSEFELIQLVKFETWSRMVGTERRSSILDHIYIKDPTLVSDMKYLNPFFGDPVLVEFVVNASKSKNVIPLNWLNLSMDLYKIKCKRIFLSV